MFVQSVPKKSPFWISFDDGHLSISSDSSTHNNSFDICLPVKLSVTFPLSKVKCKAETISFIVLFEQPENITKLKNIKTKKKIVYLKHIPVNLHLHMNFAFIAFECEAPVLKQISFTSHFHLLFKIKKKLNILYSKC